MLGPLVGAALQLRDGQHHQLTLLGRYVEPGEDSAGELAITWLTGGRLAQQAVDVELATGLAVVVLGLLRVEIGRLDQGNA